MPKTVPAGAFSWLKEDTLKNIKKLAIDLDRTVNDLLEEGIEYLLKKYEKKSKTQT